jgi:hypothetical protein
MKVAEREATRFATALKGAVAQQVNDHGLYQAIRFVEYVNQLITAEQHQTQQRLDKVRADLAAWEQMQRAGQTGGKHLWSNHRQTYIYQAREKERLLLQEKKLLMYQTLLPTQLAEVGASQNRLLGWLHTLHQVQTNLKRQAGQVSQDRATTRPVCVVNLLDYLDEAAEDELIAAQVQTHWPEATEKLCFAWYGDQLTLCGYMAEAPLPGPKSLVSEPGLEKFLGYARSFFDFSNITVEDWLRASGKSLDEWLADFEMFAAPLVTLDEAKHPQPKVIKIIGAEKGQAGFFAEAVRLGWAVVETVDRHNVEVLITWHHLNWRWLSQAESWRRAAERLSDAPLPSEPLQSNKPGGDNNPPPPQTNNEKELEITDVAK